MTNVMGRPGTRSSLALRVSQFVCAAASWFTIVDSDDPVSYSAFGYLAGSMFMQIFWSFALACIDIVCLVCNNDVHEPGHVSVILIGDWCLGILSFSAATASAGITIYFKRDTEFCRAFSQSSCDQYELAVILAFVEWSFIAASALSLFWLRASF